VGENALRQLSSSLEANDPFLKTALLRVLSTQYHLSLDGERVKLSFSKLDETDFRSDSNLEHLGLSADAAHAAIESACLGVGGMNMRLEEMRDYDAMSGFIDSEHSLLREKLGFIAASLSPAAQELRVERVLTIVGLPQFGTHGPTKVFDADSFLEVRASRECQEFRSWLRQIDAASDKEIVEQVRSIRARFGDLAQSRGGSPFASSWPH
jgi:hypothetical protein